MSDDLDVDFLNLKAKIWGSEVVDAEDFRRLFEQRFEQCDVRALSTGCRCPEPAAHVFRDEDGEEVARVCDRCKHSWEGMFPRFTLEAMT